MKKLTLEQFVERSNNIHKFKYSYVNSIYVNVDTKLEIICPTHGSFYQRPDHHLKGHCCKKCSVKSSVDTRKISLDDFKSDCNKKHDNFYDYSLIDYKNEKDMLIIICPKHGEFTQRADHHKRGSGCPKCKMVSKGEIEISKILIKHDINFEFQKTFEDFRSFTNNYYKFDFYIPKLNLLIEYDGIQHFKPVKYFGGDANLVKNQKNDTIKNKFCEDNNIPLLRISYNDKINKKLKEVIDQYNNVEHRL